jgi:hypothetical protein
MCLFPGASEKTGVTVIQQESTAETPPPDTNQSDCSTQETNQSEPPVFLLTFSIVIHASLLATL